MANATGHGNNRHGNGHSDKREAMANGTYAPVRGKTYQSPIARETEEEAEARRAKHAAATGTRKSLWR